MKNTLYPDHFVEVWNSAESVSEVAQQLGITRSCAATRAYILRKQGRDVKKFSGPANIKSCAECGKAFHSPPSTRRVYCGKRCSILHKGLNSRTHGDSRTRLYSIWCNMKARCKGTSSRLARMYYSDRGIEVCREWKDDFTAFKAWAMGNGYKTHLELDRIDNDKGYSPSNCRWATRQQQMQNTRKRCDARTSKYKGVSKHSQNGNWTAQGHRDGRPVHIGSFLCEEDAARAYDKWASDNYGEFANLNFPHTGGVPR
jgi:hypothetical protein